MQDIEFTVQQGRLWMLQTRSGKRTAGAAPRIAVDMVVEGLISESEAVRRIEPPSLDQLLPPSLDRKSVVYGKSVSVRVGLGWRRVIKKKTKQDKIRSRN